MKLTPAGVLRSIPPPLRRPARDGLRGAIAQLGERYNGIVEVDGSIPSGSTNQINYLSCYCYPMGQQAGAAAIYPACLVQSRIFIPILSMS